MEIYKEIVNNDYVIPSHKEKYQSINQFIEALLEKNVSKRICNATELKKLELFKGYEWDKLNDFKIPPPYIPKMFDCSHVMKSDLTPFEKELIKEGSEIYEDTACDEVSSSAQCDKTWADEF